MYLSFTGPYLFSEPPSPQKGRPTHFRPPFGAVNLVYKQIQVTIMAVIVRHFRARMPSKSARQIAAMNCGGACSQGAENIWNVPAKSARTTPLLRAMRGGVCMCRYIADSAAV
jgi:hypothetical protein